MDENTWERVNISETKSRTFIVAHETQNDSCSSSSTPTQKPNQKQTTPTPKIQNNQNSNTNIINNSNNNNSNNENNQNNNNVDESQLQQQQQIQIQIQQQQTMHDNYQTKEDILNDIVKERNQKIKQIKHDLESVHDLMQVKKKKSAFKNDVFMFSTFAKHRKFKFLFPNNPKLFILLKWMQEKLNLKPIVQLIKLRTPLVLPRKASGISSSNFWPPP